MGETSTTCNKCTSLYYEHEAAPQAVTEYNSCFTLMLLITALLTTTLSAAIATYSSGNHENTMQTNIEDDDCHAPEFFPDVYMVYTAGNTTGK